MKNPEQFPSEKMRPEESKPEKKRRKEKSPILQSEQKEKEQTPEEIRTVLETALRERYSVDLIILTLDNKPRETLDLIVEEIDGDYLMMSYLDEKGELGEVIPLEISRVTKAKLRKPPK